MKQDKLIKPLEMNKHRHPKNRGHVLMSQIPKRRSILREALGNSYQAARNLKINNRKNRTTNIIRKIGVHEHKIK